MDIEKDRVPKMTSHFETLSEKVRASNVPGGVADSGEEEGRGEKGGQEPRKQTPQLKPRGVGKFEVHEEEEKDSAKARTKNMQGNEGETEKRREEKRERKVESGDEGREGLSLEEISKYRQTAQQNSTEAIRAAEERYMKANEEGASVEAKETAPSVAERAKDATVDTAKKVGSYAGEKAVAVKDAAVDTGKSAAGYVEKVAVEVKDKAAVAGWGAPHYTCEKTGEATEAAANITRGVAGYAGGKAAAAKDAAAHAGQRAVEYTSEKVAAAKDTVVATEESAKDYTARKKAEAERDLEARKSAQPEGETGGQDTAETVEEFLGGAPQQERMEQEEEGVMHESGVEEGSGVLKAIGETIVEIVQKTKELLVGQDQSGEEPNGVYEDEGSALDYGEKGEKKQEELKEGCAGQ